MIRNILVPTDFSNDAYNALFYVTQLYKNQKCTFHILHAYNSLSHFKKEYKNGRTTKDLTEYIHDRTVESLEETYHKIILDTEKNALHEFVMVSKNAFLDKAVKAYLHQNTIDLIAMGTKGRTSAIDIFLGGNTIQMVKSNVDCPVLCVPKQIDYHTIAQIGYVTSFKHPLEKYSLSIVKSLANHHQASIHIVHINDTDTLQASQEENKAILTDFFEASNLVFHIVSGEKSKAKTVAKFAKKQAIDLLAMCYYPHFLLDKLFREPMVLDLSIYTDIPLLILPSEG